MKNSVMEISVNNFKNNIEEIKKLVKPDTIIMPVIKANAYGTYLNKKIDVINDFEIVAVANVYEALEIRKIGYEKEIFILNQPDILVIDDIVKADAVIGLSSIEFLEEAIRQNVNLRVHLEIETGMGRTGIYPEKLLDFILKIKSSNNIKVEGIYTHFPIADEDLEFTKKQIDKFTKAVEIAKEYFDLKYIHCQASNGILNTESLVCNTIRPGIIMYGYESYQGAGKKLDLKPVAKLKSRINFIKTIEKGESVSYMRKFIASEKTRVATVPLGYADGIKRALFGKGEVVIHGKKAPIIGIICMDSFMVDVSNIPDAKVGDDVYIWDNDVIKIEDIAKECNTINYEIISTISDRVERVFV